MNVLIACEFSAVVRNAFIARGHDAWSCDLLPSEGRQGNHLVGDVRWALEGQLAKFPDAIDIRTGNQPLYRAWDLLIAHPPCTYLCNSGVRWLYGGSGFVKDQQRWELMERDARFFSELLTAPIDKIAVENPIMHSYARNIVGELSAQTIQPWMFGHNETKATSLWLKGLPKLKPAFATYVDFRKAHGLDDMSSPVARVHLASPGKDRWKERSRTLHGIAEAFATQWG